MQRSPTSERNHLAKKVLGYVCNIDNSLINTMLNNVHMYNQIRPGALDKMDRNVRQRLFDTDYMKTNPRNHTSYVTTLDGNAFAPTKYYIRRMLECHERNIWGGIGFIFYFTTDTSIDDVSLTTYTDFSEAEGTEWIAQNILLDKSFMTGTLTIRDGKDIYGVIKKPTVRDVLYVIKNNGLLNRKRKTRSYSDGKGEYHFLGLHFYFDKLKDMPDLDVDEDWEGNVNAQPVIFYVS